MPVRARVASRRASFPAAVRAGFGHLRVSSPIVQFVLIMAPAKKTEDTRRRNPGPRTEPPDMPNPWTEIREQWADIRESQRTRQCARAAHTDCPHFSGMGGGFNFLRLRPEIGAGLCPCSCHSSCPATPAGKRLTVPWKTWYATCTCPGAEQKRRSMDEAGIEFPDFGEVREEARRRSQLRTEAFQATQGRASGKSRAEIRQIYVAELRERGLKIPPEHILDAIVERIKGNPLPAARIAGESLVGMGRRFRELFKVLRQGQ